MKFTVKFKGREMQHIQLGKDLMNRIIEDTKEVGEIETHPKFEGKTNDNGDTAYLIKHNINL